MSDNELENDLFGGSDDEAPPKPPSPTASSSRGSPKPEHSGTATPAVNNEEDDGIGADLFGDEDEDQPASPRRREGTSPDTPVSLRSSRSPNPLEYAEEDVREPEEQQQTWVSMPFPTWDGLKPTDGKIWQLRLPAYVNMESTPYDANLFRAGIEPIGEEEDVTVKRSRMISVRNTIRWKWVTGDDGQPKRQSNSRLLRWSDGSVSLQLGSDLYDLAPSYGATLARASDPPPKNPLPEKAPGANTTFLAYSSSSDEVLMTESTIAGQVSLVPASSSSKTHIELVKHVGQQHVKHSRMKVLEEVIDPEKAHAAAIGGGGKKKAGKRGTGGGGGGGSSRTRTRKRDSSEEEEDSRYTYDADGPRRGVRGGPKGYEAEYDEDDGFVVADSDEDGEGEVEEEGADDGDYGGRSSKKSKSKSKAKKRKGGSEELDEMEEMERRIEASEREKKRARRDRKEKSRRRDYETDEDDEEDEPATAAQTDKDADGEEEDMDMDMDVESEED